jgi:hypothetical protein
MKSKAKSVVVLTVILSLGFAACAGSQPTPGITVAQLTGVWEQVENPAGEEGYLQLSQDGTYRFATTAATLKTVPLEAGRFELEGTSLTFITSANEGIMCRGLSGSYQVEPTEQGQLRFVLQEEACEGRARYRPGTWSRYEP